MLRGCVLYGISVTLRYFAIMRNKNNRHLGIEVEPELHYKLHYIAKYEGRSGNGQILHLIRQCIRDFESENGKIPFDNNGKESQD